MAKKGKPKKGKSRNPQGEGDGDGPYDSLPYPGLLVKISKNASGEPAGRMFLIPARDLLQFLFSPQNEAAFDAAVISNPLINVDYAVYTEDFRVRGSAG